MAQDRNIWFQKMRRLFKGLTPGSVSELEPFDAYELWADTYEKTDGNALLFADESAVRPLLESLPLQGKAILDAGCGAGRYLEILQRFQPRLFVGMDFVPNMIEKARKRIDLAPSVELQVSRLEQLPFKDEKFDFVVCTLVLGHILRLESAVAELARVLRRNGTMVISCFHPYGQLLGWVRSFRIDSPRKRSQWCAAKYYRHLHSDYFRAFQLSQLEVVQMLEAVIDDALKPYYERAGRMDLYERYEGYPLLLIFEVRKQ